MCGGTRKAIDREINIAGLSPRVRGNRALNPQATVSKRSIPACAGEPLGVAGSAGRRGVYPRVCGGTAVGDGKPFD